MTPILISYIPALHKGYVDFFKKYAGGTLYILGDPFVKEHPRMDRDLRALAPEEIKAMVEALGIFSSVEVLNEKTLEKLETETPLIVIPDEDLNRKFAKTHLPGKTVKFVKTFLRWDKQISTTEFEIPPDRIISAETLDQELMATALQEAEKSSDWWRQIGAILTDADKKFILAAHNNSVLSEYTLNALGDPRSNFDAGERIDLVKTIHAEAAVIARAARRGIPLEGAYIYVTTFPCPVCAKSIAEAGIKKLFYSKGYSLLDAEDVLRAYDVEIVMMK